MQTTNGNDNRITGRHVRRRRSSLFFFLIQYCNIYAPEPFYTPKNVTVHALDRTLPFPMEGDNPLRYLKKLRSAWCHDRRISTFRLGDDSCGIMYILSSFHAARLVEEPCGSIYHRHPKIRACVYVSLIPSRTSGSDFFWFFFYRNLRLLLSPRRQVQTIFLWQPIDLRRTFE